MVDVPAPVEAAWIPSGQGRIAVTAGGSVHRVVADATFALDEVAAAGRELGSVRFDAAQAGIAHRRSHGLPAPGRQRPQQTRFGGAHGAALVPLARR